jgi:RNA polymerase sigma-70 factor (ECF subfamily)
MAYAEFFPTWPGEFAPGVPESRARVSPADEFARMPAAATATRAADPDADDVAAARGGDPDAFRALVERHRDRAHALAWRMLRSAPDAEEVAQDAFVRAWRGLPDFRGEARFGTWLHSIVARLALDRLEVLSRRRRREAALDAAGEMAAAGHEAADTLGERRMQALVAGLNAPQQAVVRLYYYEDRSVETVSELLGIPENTVKTHLSRARESLRKGWAAAGEQA